MHVLESPLKNVRCSSKLVNNLLKRPMCHWRCL